MLAGRESNYFPKLKLLLLIFFTVFLTISCNTPVQAPLTSSSDLNKIKEISGRLNKNFNLKIQYENFNNVPWWSSLAGVKYTNFKDDNVSELQLFMTWLEYELEQYPADFFRKINVENIFLVKKLVHGNESIEGLSICDGGIFLSIEKHFSFDLSWIDHEFYHSVDCNDRKNNSYSEENQKWENLNSKTFSYNNVDSVSPFKDFPAPGFVSSYAMTNAREDRAEVYGCLFNSSCTAQLDNKIGEGDIILEKKEAFIKNNIQKNFPQMDDTYWFLSNSLYSGGENIMEIIDKPESIKNLDIWEPAPLKYPRLILRRNNALKYLDKLINLNRLSLNHFDINEFPFDIKNLKNLEFLNLEANSFTKIPDGVFELKKLKRLNISYNKIKYIPKEIENLTNLESLDIHKNDITDLPDEISNLKNLKEIFIDSGVRNFDKLQAMFPSTQVFPF